MIIICKKHGEFLQTPDDHIRGHGCPRCKHSKGESIIYKFLKDEKIDFEEQKGFDGCRNPLTNKLLPFDFYLSKFNACIEFDGEQHFKEMRFNKKSLKIIQYRDGVKNNFCKENNIFLLRIPYTEIKRVKDIINEKILFIVQSF